MFNIFRKKADKPPAYTDYKVDKEVNKMYFTQLKCFHHFCQMLQEVNTEDSNIMYMDAIDNLINNQNAFTVLQWQNYLIEFKLLSNV